MCSYSKINNAPRFYWSTDYDADDKNAYSTRVDAALPIFKDSELIEAHGVSIAQMTPECAKSETKITELDPVLLLLSLREAIIIVIYKHGVRPQSEEMSLNPS